MINVIKRYWDYKFVRFLIVGTINTLFGYSAFSLLILIGCNYIVAGFLATIAGILFNFKTVGGIVFNSHDNLLIFKFFLVYGIAYLVNMAILTVVLKFFQNIYVIQASLLLPMAFFTYALNKYLVFPK